MQYLRTDEENKRTLRRGSNTGWRNFVRAKTLRNFIILSMAYLEYKSMRRGDCENRERTCGNKQQQQKEHSRSRNKSKERKIMANGPITSWQIDGETVETVADFVFLDSKITADGDCSHEIKRCSLLGRKVMTNLDSILKSRDITLPTKVRLVKAMVFPVVMYGCES